MKVTIEFTNELEHALQMHLNGELSSIQNYIRASVRFFKEMYLLEKEGKKIGYGSAGNFERYNNEVSPKILLSNNE